MPRSVAQKAPTMLTFGQTRDHFTLSARQRLSSRLEDVFPFFADAHNLEALTPPFLSFSIRSPGPIDMREGTLIEYRIKLHGIPIGWRTRIDVWEPPLRFVDRQLRGPYRLWRHEHRFEAQGDSTLVLDEVAYRVLGGAPVNALLVRPDLRRIFTYRRTQLAARFGELPDAAE